LNRRGNVAWLLAGVLLASGMGTLALLQGNAGIQNAGLEDSSSQVESGYAMDMASLSSYFRASCNPNYGTFSESLGTDAARGLASQIGSVSMTREDGDNVYCAESGEGPGSLKRKRCLRGATPPAPT